MLKELLAAAINDRLRGILSEFVVGDEWRNPVFSILFENMHHISPIHWADDDEWTAVEQLIGKAFVRIYTDGLSPIDPTLLMLNLRSFPIKITPDPQTPMDGYTLFLRWKPDFYTDVLFESSGVGYVEISAKFEDQPKDSFCYIVKRIGYYQALPETFSNVFIYYPAYQPGQHQPSLENIGPFSWQSVAPKADVIYLKQTKIVAIEAIEDGVFSVLESTAEYSVNYTWGILANDEEEFDKTVQVTLNGRVLDKGTEVIFVSPSKFKYMGFVDPGDQFVLYSFYNSK